MQHVDCSVNRPPANSEAGVAFFSMKKLWKIQHVSRATGQTSLAIDVNDLAGISHENQKLATGS